MSFSSQEEQIDGSATTPLGVSSWILLLACAVIPPAFATGFTRFEDVKVGVAGILLGALLFSLGGRVVMGKRVTVASGRPVRFAEFSVAVGLGAALSGLFGVIDLAGAGLFAPVWDSVGTTAAFDAKEFSRPFYAIALPVMGAGMWCNTGMKRLICTAGLGLGTFHFGLMATWPTLGIAIGAVGVTTLVVRKLILDGSHESAPLRARHGGRD